MSEEEENTKIAKLFLQLEMASQEMSEIKHRLYIIQEENKTMKTVLEEINERTQQFKKSSHDIMIEAPWSPNESIS
jgi:hypothetical protein